jgi:hypothetical protein
MVPAAKNELKNPMRRAFLALCGAQRTHILCGKNAVVFSRRHLAV